MPDLKRAPGAAVTKAKQLDPRRTRAKRAGGGWMDTMKVVFLLERPRQKRSSPSPRQIALVVVSGGLAIMVIRVLARRKGASAGAETETAPAATPQAETEAQADGAATPQPAGVDDATASASTLTDRVQSEMSRRDDAPAPATGAD